MCSTRKATFSMGGQDVWCEEREPVVLGDRIWSRLTGFLI